MERLYTSHSANSICIEIIQNSIILSAMPRWLKERDLMVFISDYADNKYNKKIFTKGTDIRYKIPSLNRGIYGLNILFDGENGYFYSYLNRSQILIKIDMGTAVFFDSPIYMKNTVWFAKFSKSNQSNPNFLNSCSSIQSKDYRIIRLAKDITCGLILPYSKVIAIHDWVANNISYDYDALKTGSYKTDDSSALTTLLNKRGVCQGYSNLTVALLRALNIPASEISCFSLGIDTHGGWENPENLAHSANHVITIAYVINRWVFMDTTWNSNNKYENGVFCISNNECSHLYFDTHMRFLSNTHKLSY